MIKNIPNEMMFVASLFKKPDLFVQYNDSNVVPDYDFSDKVSKFLYNSFSVCYQTYTTEVTENKFNVFMSQDKKMLDEYKEYGGWNTINKAMKLADENDIPNLFDTLKKYSLLREYQSKGFMVDKIIEHPKFHTLTSNQVYQIQRKLTDSIHTKITGDTDIEDLSENVTDTLVGFIETPDVGEDFGWERYNEVFHGLRNNCLILECLGSNLGKSRKLVHLAVYLAFVRNRKVAIFSNEMTKESMQSCMITTVVNHPELKKIIGVDITKPEEEIIKGLYRDDKTNKLIMRETDLDGEYVLELDDHKKNIKENSTEFRKIVKISRWIEKRLKNIVYKDVSKDYSDPTLEMEIKKAVIGHGAEFIMYDTVKNWKHGGYMELKETCTMLSGLSRELEVGIYGVNQATDDTVHVNVEDLSTMNIGASKTIYHVLDFMTISKRLTVDQYDNYSILSEYGEVPLDPNKVYTCAKILKNRKGIRDVIVAFEVDLDLNTHNDVGYLIMKGSKSKVISKTIQDNRR